jgi:Uma2 family endonuclease
MAVARSALTLAQFMALPEEEQPLEYADGVVTQKVSPKGTHSILQYVLAERFNRVGLPQKRVRAFPELRVTFAGASRVPDIAVYRWDRIPRDADGQVADDFVEPPDVAVEIASPGQSSNALVRRCLWYTANEVAVALLVDPADESVIVFREGGGVSALRGDDPIDVGDVAPDPEISVAELFQSLRD